MRIFVILSALLFLVDLLDLLEFFITVSIVFLGFHVMLGDLSIRIWRIIYFPFFLSYVKSCVLLSQNLWAKDVPYEVVCWLTLDLVYLYSRMIFPCLLLGYKLLPVVKSFSKSTFIFLCWFPLCWRRIYDSYLSLVLFLTSSYSY